ncbi:MAG: hypothetical protein C0623_06375 [Desulfuromonas sp.]|nr:MAG: hypothetical protein C0623_06375 [Desulfuromonas sp.]
MKNLERRDFLKLTLATAAVPVLLGAGSNAWALVNRQMVVGDKLMSLGYWPGSEKLPLLQPESPSAATLTLATDGLTLGEITRTANLSDRLVDASRLPAGDAALLKRGCRLTVHGMTGLDGTPSAADMQSVALQVHSKVAGVDEKIPWQIWSYQGGPAQNVSSAVTANVPLVSHSLDLTLTLGDDKPQTVPLLVTVGRDFGQPKLRRGFYLLAVQGRPGQQLPNWRFSRMNVSTEREEHAERLDYAMQSIPSGQPKYLVFSIDYADTVDNG